MTDIDLNNYEIRAEDYVEFVIRFLPEYLNKSLSEMTGKIVFDNTVFFKDDEDKDDDTLSFFVNIMSIMRHLRTGSDSVTVAQLYWKFDTPEEPFEKFLRKKHNIL